MAALTFEFAHILWMEFKVDIFKYPQFLVYIRIHKFSGK